MTSGASFFNLLIVYALQRVNFEHMDELSSKIVNKQEYKYIIDRLEHSIVIIADDQIDFVNSKFLNQFH